MMTMGLLGWILFGVTAFALISLLYIFGMIAYELFVGSFRG